MKEMPKATEAEVELLEKNHWKTVLRGILSDWRLYVMLLPLSLVLLLWRYLPIGTMIMSFKYYVIDSSFGRGAYTSTFTGFANFESLFSNYEFWSAFRNTFALSFYGLIFGFPFPILLALFFSEIRIELYRSAVQIFSYLPKFISTVIVTTLIGMLLRSTISAQVAAGPIGAIFESLFGLKNMVSSPKSFRSIYIISGLWEGAGYGSIVYFAAILGISPTNYEAARIDGASKMQQIRYVTLPGMSATLVIMLILRLGQLLTIGYEKVYLLQQLGTPESTYETSQIISTYVINRIMTNNSNQGIGAAADLFNALLSMVLVLGSNRIAKKVSSTSLF